MGSAAGIAAHMGEFHVKDVARISHLPEPGPWGEVGQAFTIRRFLDTLSMNELADLHWAVHQSEGTTEHPEGGFQPIL